MPAYFSNMPDASMALINALLDDANPRSYQAIFKDISPDHVVMATNEEDNAFTPSMQRVRWSGLAQSGAVGKSQMVSFQTEVLAPGKYVFTLVPLASQPGGDADLRARGGQAPDATQTFKCKSYVGNSNERCVLTVTTAAKVFLTVTGDKVGVQSAWELRGNSQQ